MQRFIRQTEAVFDPTSSLKKPHKGRPIWRYQVPIFALAVVFLFSLAACEPETHEAQSKTKNPVTGTVSRNAIEAPPTSAPMVPSTSRIPGDLVNVVSVTDGDTIKVQIGTQTKTIRFIGIDTPETKDPRKPVQCFGQEASNKMKELVENKQVIIESDTSQGELDKYGRLLRYVFLPDGTNVNLKMISDGYAHEYTYNLPYKYQSEFKAAQKDADINNRGLWAPTTCNGDTSQAIVRDPTPIQTSASGSSTAGVVKKSNSGICHGPGTTYYNQTKNFTPFNSIQECIDSGGRLPKRQKQSKNRKVWEPIWVRFIGEDMIQINIPYLGDRNE